MQKIICGMKLLFIEANIGWSCVPSLVVFKTILVIYDNIAYCGLGLFQEDFINHKPHNSDVKDVSTMNKVGGTRRCSIFLICMLEALFRC